MAAPVNTQWKILLELLYGDPSQKPAVSQKLLRTHAKETGFPDALESYHPTGRVRCTELLELCRPVMERLSSEPPEGWLPFLYEYLSNGLFPDSSRPTASRALRQACWFYVSVLDWQLSLEAGRCPEDPLSDVPPLTEAELSGSRIANEFLRFCNAVRESHFLALMRIGREVMPFDPASHTIGVHHIALTTARQAAEAGLPVDVALVSASSFSHDIGKFGCRGADARRIPYLHYYYTWQWLTDHGCHNIAHIAANHSTWDLEFENLPLESLILI